MVLEAILEDDYTVKSCEDSLSAIEYATGHTPDLILLDIMMPDIDGFELCRRMKSLPHLRTIPVIFITSKNDVISEETGFAAGASDFIQKPISAPLVHARIKTHLKLKFAHDLIESTSSALQEPTNKLAALKRIICSDKG